MHFAQKGLRTLYVTEEIDKHQPWVHLGHPARHERGRPLLRSNDLVCPTLSPSQNITATLHDDVKQSTLFYNSAWHYHHVCTIYLMSLYQNNNLTCVLGSLCKCPYAHHFAGGRQTFHQATSTYRGQQTSPFLLYLGDINASYHYQNLYLWYWSEQ